MMGARIGFGWKCLTLELLLEEGARRRAHSAVVYPEQDIRVDDEISAAAPTTS